jgi:hypothetical protein
MLIGPTCSDRIQDSDPDYVLIYKGKLHFYPKSFITDKLLGAIRMMAESLDVKKFKE